MAESSRIFDHQNTRPRIFLDFSMFPKFAEMDAEDFGRMTFEGVLSSDKSVDDKRFKAIRIKGISIVEDARIG
jgi:hypothetical protein